MQINRFSRGLLGGAILFSMAASTAAQTPPVRKAPTRPVAKAPASSATPAAPIKYKGIFEPVNYGQDINLHDVFFVTPEVGWVAGEKGTILHTKDGGANWTAQLGGDPQSQEGPIGFFYFLDETHGWAAQEVGAYSYQLLRTVDGENWQKVGLPRSDWINYAFTSENNGFALTRGGSVSSNAFWRTQDAGRTWKQVELPPSAKMEIEGLSRDVQYSMVNFHLSSPTVVYVVGGTREVSERIFVLKSENGGDNWTVRVAEGPNFAGTHGLGGAELFFTDENTGYVTVLNGLFATTDGGETWRSLFGSPGGKFRFADPEVGWAFAGDGATWSWTTDGGKKWSSRPLRFPAAARAFSLPQRDCAYVVGDHGMVYRYRVAPETEAVSAKAVAAPAMPGIQTALDEQVSQLRQRLQSFEQAVEKKTGQQIEITPVTETSEAAGAAPPESEGAAAGPGMAEQVAPQQLEAIASTVENLNAEVPKFTGKFRNLNLIFQGLQMVGQLFGQAQGLKDSLGQLKKAKDVASISAALSQLTGQTQGLVQSAKSAFQAPQQ